METVIKNLDTNLDTIIVNLPPEEYRGLPRRDYDFNKGDYRSSCLASAILHANLTAEDTGVRQVVRPDSPVLGETMYLVQAVGS